MKRVIRVECWADFYFFGKLLLNKELIRKEKNKPEVFKSIKERAKEEFSIGIVDSDDDAIEPFLKGFTIEERFFVCEEVELIKIQGYHYYIIQLYPKEFEKWILRFVEKNCGKTLVEFGYKNYKDFEADSKVIPEKMERNERFLKVLGFVLNEHSNSINHIHKLKKVLEYLIEKNYAADINELKNV